MYVDVCMDMCTHMCLDRSMTCVGTFMDMRLDIWIEMCVDTHAYGHAHGHVCRHVNRHGDRHVHRHVRKHVCKHVRPPRVANFLPLPLTRWPQVQTQVRDTGTHEPVRVLLYKPTHAPLEQRLMMIEAQIHFWCRQASSEIGA